MGKRPVSPKSRREVKETEVFCTSRMRRKYPDVMGITMHVFCNLLNSIWLDEKCGASSNPSESRSKI